LTDQEFIDRVAGMSEFANTAVSAFGGVAAMKALRDEALKKHQDLPSVQVDWGRVAVWLNDSINRAMTNFEKLTS
jgi:hypothetical protein